MFVDCQNVAALWGRKFVGNWFVALLHYFDKYTWGHSFMREGNPRTLNPP